MKRIARYILPTLFVTYVIVTMGGELVQFFMMIAVIAIVVKACGE